MHSSNVSADLIGTDIDVDTDSIFDYPPVEISPVEKEIIENDDDFKKVMVKISDLVPTQRTVNMRRVKDALDSKGPVRVWDDGGVLKLVDGHHRTALRKLNGAGTIAACVCKRSITASASKPAPKKDRVHGSSVNKPGSAAGGKTVKFSAKTEETLSNKVKEHNEKVSPGRKATLAQLKAVYRRGAGAYSSSHRAGVGRDQWAMARVNAYLRLLKSGRPSNPNYVQDNDLLPASHPKSSKKDAQVITASGLVDDVAELAEVEAFATSELAVSLLSEEEYDSPEHALLAMAELSGAGYEIVPALRAAWLRGIRDKESPFRRASMLASALYSCKDADLLPVLNKEGLDK